MDRPHFLRLQPGVLEPTGRIEEDERIFGCVEVGIGTQGEGLGGKSWVAANHTDGMVLNPTIYLDEFALKELGFSPRKRVRLI